MSRVFANGPGDRGSIKGKVQQSQEWSRPFPTPRCSGYWKGSLWVALDKGRQLYFLTMKDYFLFGCWLVVLYGIWTIVCYLIPNLDYTYGV